MEIHKNVISGSCGSSLMRIQIRYTAFFIGQGLLPKNWHGLQFGVFAPAHSPKIGYRCIAFYCKLLPGLPGAVSRWPTWYRVLQKQMSSRRLLTFGKGWV